MSGGSPRSALDGLGARLVAGLVLLAALGGLLAVEWRELFPRQVATTPDPNDPVAVCIAERSRQIETLVQENPSMAGQKRLFLERAEAMCRATAGPGGNGAPPPPLPSN
ncbi:hypothetical protein SAMN06265365_10157 [Tistlia consotensis]|uniref:Uncharacterized protein n=1 Tax=Tistlia consotensis USBA 355 TaxID=560819 RepID=A0A1Y6B2J0_9PROT|nr:hypothetical protein [Tistlia consotensis]SME88146.1 hypothetical protein SAMN05428998_10157 [Tistlia consotensis USBA 355]SNR24526.1 hypothetical protein SAMN06265365_10157 [Tistlia consotensis]